MHATYYRFLCNEIKGGSTEEKEKARVYNFPHLKGQFANN